ncbi:M42 family metallopeptidase [Sporanaerobacter sp. PP17-6a]|uniref:M42 family metallopeptidase n=1 Tax=Sporanaerobacter sp. PP17-6a TaxID=1891289 RepID=UPI00089FC60A|nr:M42 family metallopeptidase [Sporanaerobacter sp. PP17-6a]MBE6083522.1 M42 family metallopeptidase [Tissierellaceae bacterium]SCL81238.1 putative aminopeptidase YsdC [Sporanaerobacter sp. PP17-6a]
MNDIKTILKELTSLSGVSGHEEEVARYMYEKFKGITDDVAIDNLGNIVCHISSEVKNAPKVLVFGHMDEIGLMIKKVEKNGFLRFERIGGVNRQALPGTHVVVVNSQGKKVNGVIGLKSHHIMKQDEKSRIPEVEEMYIDIGSSSDVNVYERGIHVGCFATFKPSFTELNEDLVCSKALDDRAACTVLLRLAEELSKEVDELNSEVYLVASVQEEFNIRGIMPMVRKIKPDIAVGIDITPSFDTPELNCTASDVVLGKGPAITYMNFHGRGTLAGIIPSYKLTEFIEKVAVQNDIKFQREVITGVITETGFICIEGENGIITGNLSIPVRYSHTPIEVADLRDIDMAIKLLLNVIKEIKSFNSFRFIS